MNSFYVDFHVLQTVPPSCVNRDDTGSPKTAVYGGTTRARVSSQAWKHVMREEFKNLFDQEWLGYRTKKLEAIIKEKIVKKDGNLNSKKVDAEVNTILKDAGFKLKDGKTDALFFMSEKQAEAIAEVYFNKPEDKEQYKKKLAEALKDYPSIDMALFGRMVASDPSLNYDAAAQVAHAISTHAVQTEYDYFTAVDDCSSEDNTGAGHLGTIEYNSSTLYRYATVNVRELKEHLKDETADTVKKFAQAFIMTMPTGKQNTFANRTVPDLVYVTIRKDQPVNLCGAFEKAIPSSKGGYVEESEKRLMRYAEEVYDKFVEKPSSAYVIGTYGVENDAISVSLKELLTCLENEVAEYSEMG